MEEKLEPIMEALRAVAPGDRINRNVLREKLNIAANTNGEFERLFNSARWHLWEENIYFSAVGGQNYHRAIQEDAPTVAIKQSRRGVTKGLRAIERSCDLAASAATMSSDENQRAALERQTDRAQLMSAQVSALRRMRKF